MWLSDSFIQSHVKNAGESTKIEYSLVVCATGSKKKKKKERTSYIVQIIAVFNRAPSRKCCLAIGNTSQL